MMILYCDINTGTESFFPHANLYWRLNHTHTESAPHSLALLRPSTGMLSVEAAKMRTEACTAVCMCSSPRHSHPVPVPVSVSVPVPAPVPALQHLALLHRLAPLQFWVVTLK